jgi:hypothetical protein
MFGAARERFEREAAAVQRKQNRTRHWNPWWAHPSVLTSLFTISSALLVLPAITIGHRTSSSSAAQENKLRVRVDAFEAGSWNGIVMVVDDQTAFQVRVGAQAEFGDYLDGDNVSDYLEESFHNSVAGKRAGQWATHLRTASLYDSITEVGPHSPDGSYSRVAWNPLHPYETGSRIVLEWTRLDENSVLAKVTYSAPVRQIDYNTGSRAADIVLESYSPWDATRGMVGATYSASRAGIVATSEYRPVLGELEWNQWRFNFSTNNSELRPEDEPGRRADFFGAELNDSAWKTVRWGAYWQEEPGTQQPGYGWYRHRVRIPSAWKGKVLRLELGKISENDWTFFNGSLIGSMFGKKEDRTYEIRPEDPAYSQIHWDDENVLAIQVQASGPFGGISSGEVVPWGRSAPPPRPRILSIASDTKIVGMAVAASKDPSSVGSYERLYDLQKGMQQDGKLSTKGGSRYAALHFADLHEENKKQLADNAFYFLMTVGSPGSSLANTAKQKLSSLDPEEILRAKRTSYEKSRVHSEGEFAGSAEMTANTMHWSVLYGPEQKSAFVVDSRRWCVPNQWFLAGNSAVMSAWGAALESRELAQNTLIGILREELPNGMVPNMAGSWFSTPTRSQDMYAAYSAWKIYTKYRDLEFLRAVYPQIKAWHEWWFADRGDGQPRRDGDRDGLLEIGSDAVAPGTPEDPHDTEAYGNLAQTAAWESFDDSPMYNNYERGPAVHPDRYVREPGVRFVYKTGTFNVDLVHENALWALSAECLGKIADELGYKNDAEQFRHEYVRIKDLINAKLWDEKTGFYWNRLWESDGGKFSYRKSPATFWVLAAGIPDKRQADRMVKEHLLNPKEFWGEYVLPSISRDDPAYVEQYYWRGAIWAPMNYFAYEGRKRYGYDVVADELVKKTYSLVKKNWDETGGLYENYDSINGKGDPGGAQTTIHYSWSATLPLLAVMELIDYEAWDGLRFGALGLDRDASVDNIEIAGHHYTVQAGTRTNLWRDGQHLFTASGPAVIRGFEWANQRISFRIKTPADFKSEVIRLENLEFHGSTARVHIDDEALKEFSVLQGGLAFEVPAGEHSISIELPSRVARGE